MQSPHLTPLPAQGGKSRLGGGGGTDTPVAKGGLGGWVCSPGPHFHVYPLSLWLGVFQCMINDDGFWKCFVMASLLRRPHSFRFVFLCNLASAANTTNMPTQSKSWWWMQQIGWGIRIMVRWHGSISQHSNSRQADSRQEDKTPIQQPATHEASQPQPCAEGSHGKGSQHHEKARDGTTMNQHQCPHL